MGTDKQAALFRHATIVDAVLAQVDADPHASCVVYRGAVVNRRAFLEKAREVAVRLAQAGVGRGDHVVVQMARSPQFVAAAFGVLLAGATFVPMELAQPRRRQRSLQELLRPAAVICDESWSGESGLAAPALQVSDTFAAGPPSATFERVVVEPTDIAYVICTSGSTGTPKGVRISHGALANYSYWATQEYGLAHLDGACLSSGIGFDGTLLSVFVPLVAGCPIVVAPDGEDIEFLAALLQPGNEWNGLLNTSPSHLDAVSPLVPTVVDAQKRCLFVVGGETVTARSLSAWMSRFPKSEFVNEYGPTETTIACTFHRIAAKDLEAIAIPIGRPIAGMDVTVVDSAMEPLAAGAVGELLISGAGVADGYLGQDELNAQRFVRHPRTGARAYRSGDIGFKDSDGVLHFGGRADEQVKLRGFRIEVEEVRLQLAQWQDLASSTVLHHQTEKVSQLIAFGVKRGGRDADPTTASMTTFLTDRLPVYMIPSRLVLVDRIPTTSAGKVDRSTLLEALARPDGPVVVESSAAREALAGIWDELLGCAIPKDDDNFFELGGNSVKATQMIALVQRHLGLELRPAQIFERYRFGDLLELITQRTAVTEPPRQMGGLAGNATAIAVIGIGLRFPGASGWQEFWRNLIEKKESITHFTADELDPSVRSIAEESSYVKARGIITHADAFDAEFFRMTPAEAALLDPQHRVFLEVCWAAMEDGGYPPSSPRRVGVFAGCGSDTYTIQNVVPRALADGDLIDLPARLFNDKDYLTSRVSHKLNLTGPSINVNTACSTSLVAVVLAVKALRDGLCDMALAGGVSVDVPIRAGYRYVEGSMLSPDGRCRPFDSKAAGTTFNSGAGVVLLKPLDRALEDHDTIYGVIRGVGINNDGGEKSSFAAPSIAGQAAAVRMAIDDAGTSPNLLDFIEAHGTGTPIGDPIEVEGLMRVFNGQTERKQFCALGAVKSNIGHLVAAAGVAGLVKAVLSLKHGVYPATLHFDQPNPQIDFERSPFFVAKDHVAFQSASIIRGGVSSFGVGGTNAHVIVESLPQTTPVPRAGISPVPPYRIFPLAARDPESLTRVIERLVAEVAGAADVDLRDCAYTLQERRLPMRYRATVVADTKDGLIAGLKRGPQVTESPKDKLKLNFVFTGQGSQYPGMARELAAKHPAFAAALEECFDVLRKHHSADLRDLLLGEPNDRKELQLADTANAQPAIFAVEYAIYRTLAHLDIKPDRVIGHSIGEFMAAVAAGVLSVEDAIAAVCERGRLMGAQTRGSMLAVLASRDTVVNYCVDSVEMAAHNAPKVQVVSGPAPSIDALVKVLEAAGISARKLNTSHAFHSHMMQPAVDLMTAHMSSVPSSPPRIELISTSTAKVVSTEMADPRYWGQQLRGPVRFQEAVEKAAQTGRAIWLEVGPGTHLVTLLRQILDGNDHVIVPACSRKEDGEEYGFCEAIAQVWRHGVDVKWEALSERGRTMSLPTYPFIRKRHWIDPPTRATKEECARPIESDPAPRAPGDIEELVQMQLKTMEDQLRLIAMLDQQSS